MSDYYDYDGGGEREVELLADIPVHEHYKRRIQEAEDCCKEVWENAETNHQFVRGGQNQWPDADYQRRKRAKQPVFSHNDIALAISAIAGREISARFSPTFLGRTQGDFLADVVQEFNRAIRDRGDFEQEESDKFRDLSIESVAWVEWYQDMMERPLGVGQTKCDGVDIWEMMWDPNAKKRNLLDRMWDARGRWMSYEEAAGRYPDQEEKIKELVSAGSDTWVSDADQVSHRWPFLYVGKGKYNSREAREVFLVDYHWRERAFKYLVEVPPGLIGPDHPGLPATEMTPEQFQVVREQLSIEAANPDLKIPYVAIPYWKYRRAEIMGASEEGVLIEEDLPWPRFPRQCMTGFPFKQPDRTRFFGAVDLMKDPQIFKNIVISMMVSMLAHSPKGPTFIEAGAFVDERSALSRINQPGAAVMLNPGGIQKIKEGSHPVFPAGLEQFAQMADKAIWGSIGLNPAALGQVDDPRRISGRVFSAIQDSVSMLLSYPFDSLRLYRKESGRLAMDFMQAFYDEEHVVRLVGEETFPRDPNTGQIVVPPKSSWDEMYDFDIIVEEQPTTHNQREEFWEFLTRTDLVGHLIGSGLMPVELLAETAPIPESHRRKWAEHLAQQKEMAEQMGGEPPPEGEA